MKKRALLALGLVLSFNSYGDQTGDCTSGTQYCEAQWIGLLLIIR